MCALRAVHRVLVLGSLPASGMKDIQIQISDDRHRRHAANLATKTQPIFRSHTRWLLFPERKRLCEIENGGFSICNFSFSISHKSRPTTILQTRVGPITPRHCTLYLVPPRRSFFFVLHTLYPCSIECRHMSEACTEAHKLPLLVWEVTTYLNSY